VQSLETGARQVLIQGPAFRSRYVPTGHILYGREGSLMAVPFDFERLKVTGSPAQITEGIGAQFASSSRGTLVYGQLGAPSLVWVDRKGTARPVGAPRRAYGSPRLSPMDPRRLAVEIAGDRGYDIWSYDLDRGTSTPLTFEGGIGPTWTPDGRWVTFSSRRRASGVGNLYRVAADGSGQPERLTTSEFLHVGSSWSPDSQFLAFDERQPPNADIWVLPFRGERKPWPFLHTPFREYAPTFSPDGRWLAYVSYESGRSEINVRPFPGPGGRWQISTEGGGEPVWARNGRELFYRNGGKMMVVDITTQPGFSAGAPRLLFDGPYVRGTHMPNYDVTRDGQRFLMMEMPPAQINVVLNWFEELKRRAGAGGR
jgi:Tol biopolymer transport system component